MRGRELTRRQVLAGAAGAGGTGILVGTGTAAFFADDEVFGNAYVVGAVDLDLDWSGGTSENGPAAVEIDAPTGSETLKVQLEDLEEAENNPAYVWLRLNCPGDTDLDCDLEVRLSYVCSDDTTQRIAPDDGRDFAPLLEVANQLRTGIALAPTCDSPTPSCLEPGETIELRFEWRLTEDYDGGETTLGGDSDLFRFEAEQCRYNRSENPFDPTAIDSNCGTCVQEVSWIAFCVEGQDADPPGVKNTTELIDSGTAVDWETKNDVDYVVLKTGKGGDNEPYIVYDYRNKTKKDGTAAVGDQDAEYLGGTNGDGYFQDENCNAPDSCPGQYAKNVLEEDSNAEFSGKSTKLEEVDGKLEGE